MQGDPQGQHLKMGTVWLKADVAEFLGKPRRPVDHRGAHKAKDLERDALAYRDTEQPGQPEQKEGQ